MLMQWTSRLAGSAIVVLALAMAVRAEEEAKEKEKEVTAQEPSIERYDATAEAFAIPDGIELSKGQEKQLEELKQQWADRFAKAQAVYDRSMKTIEKSVERHRKELLRELRGREATEGEIEAINAQLQQLRERKESFYRRPLVQLQVQVRPLVDKLITDKQWAKLRSLSPGKVDKLVEDSETFATAFDLPEEIQLTEKQQKRLEELKEQWAPRFARAEFKVRDRLKTFDKVRVSQMRKAYRQDFKSSGASEEEITKAVNERIQKERQSYEDSLRRELISLLVQVQPIVRKVVTDEQWDEYHRVDPAVLDRYLSESETYQRAFRLPSAIELDEKQKKKLNSLKDRWAPRFARAEKRYQEKMAAVDQKVPAWRETLRAELADSGLSDAELTAAVEEQVQSQRQQWEQFFRRPLVRLLVGVQPELRRVLHDEQLKILRKTAFEKGGGAAEQSQDGQQEKSEAGEKVSKKKSPEKSKKKDKEPKQEESK